MKKVRRFLNNFLTTIRRPEMLILPGQLAFFFILSVVPILTLLTYLTTYLNVSTDMIYEVLATIFGSDISSLLTPHTTSSLSLGFIITIIVGYFFASNGAAAMIITSNTIYNIKDKGFIHRRIKAFIMTLFIVLLFLFILIVPLFGQRIISLFQSININQDITHSVELIINVLNGPLSWLIIFIIIKLLYTMAPDMKLSSSRTTYGAIFTSFGWVIITTIYSFYINHIAHYSRYYGSLTNIIILMLWTYLLAYVFTIGMALNYREDELKLEETQKVKTTKNN